MLTERLVIAGIALIAGMAVGANLMSWRWEAKFNAQKAEYAEATSLAATQARQAADAAWKARVEQEEASRLRAEQSAATLAAQVEELKAKRNRVEVVYRDAVKSDPDCEAWAKENIKCPISSSP